MVKALDLKSNGFYPRRFEPCSQRSFPGSILNYADVIEEFSPQFLLAQGYFKRCYRPLTDGKREKIYVQSLQPKVAVYGKVLAKNYYTFYFLLEPSL